MAMKSPIISIIVPVYNAERYVEETLNSILKQTFTDFEAICVDDGSTDGSMEILTKYTGIDKRVRVIRQKNEGVVRARNNAAGQARGEFIYFLDSDDVIDEKLLEKSYDAIMTGKGDIITCRVMTFGQENGEMVLPTPTKFNMILGNCLVNAALLRKSLFDGVNGFDATFREGLEDYDLWLNLIFRRKASFYRIPEILFYYRIKSESESRNAHALQFYHAELKNRLYVKYPEVARYKKICKAINVLISCARQIWHKRKI